MHLLFILAIANIMLFIIIFKFKLIQAILDGDEAVSRWLDYENVPLSEVR